MGWAPFEGQPKRSSSSRGRFWGRLGGSQATGSPWAVSESSLFSNATLRHSHRQN